MTSRSMPLFTASRDRSLPPSCEAPGLRTVSCASIGSQSVRWCPQGIEMKSARRPQKYECPSGTKWSHLRALASVDLVQVVRLEGRARQGFELSARRAEIVFIENDKDAR